MRFGEAIASYWTNYFVTGTRAGRSEYWWNQLLLVLGLVACGTLDVAVGTRAGIVLFVLVTTVPSSALLVRRLHDTGHSGWFVLVPVVPLVMTMLRSEGDWNRWGPPAARDAFPVAPRPAHLRVSPEVRPFAVACLCLLALTATAWQVLVPMALEGLNGRLQADLAKRRAILAAASVRPGTTPIADPETLCVARAMRDAVTAMPTATGPASYGSCHASVTSEAASGGGRVLHVTDVDARGCMALAAAELGTSNYGTVVNDSLVRDKGVRVADGAKHCTVTGNAVSLYFQ